MEKREKLGNEPKRKDAISAKKGQTGGKGKLVSFGILGVVLIAVIVVGYYLTKEDVTQDESSLSSLLTTNESSIETEQDEDGVYKNEELGFSIKYPTDIDLNIGEKYDHCVRFDVGDDGDVNEKPYVVVSHTPELEDSDSYCINKWAGWKVGKDETTDLTILGKKVTGTKIGYVISKENEDYRYEIVFKVTNEETGKTYHIAYSFMTNQGKVYKKPFQDMVMSFEFLSPN